MNSARYVRQQILPGMGPLGQQKLREARLLVIGAGGLGCPALQYLVSAGVGHITLLDDDRIEESNLHRQVLYTPADVGQHKATVAAQKLRLLNPEAVVQARLERLTIENADSFITGHDIILEGSDNFATRYLTNDRCVAMGKPLVQGSVFQYEGQVTLWNHPNGGPNLRDLYPAPPPPDAMPTCAEGGVLPALCGWVGAAMATAALRWLVAPADMPSGLLLMMDAYSFRQRELHLEADPANPLRQSPLPDLSADYDPTACAIAPVPELLPEQLLANPARYLLIDVREDWERDLDSLESLHIPLLQLMELGLPTDLNTGRQLVVYCQSGKRSAAAVRQLVMRWGIQAHSLRGGLNQLRLLSPLSK